MQPSVCWLIVPLSTVPVSTQTQRYSLYQNINPEALKIPPRDEHKSYMATDQGRRAGADYLGGAGLDALFTLIITRNLARRAGEADVRSRQPAGARAPRRLDSGLGDHPRARRRGGAPFRSTRVQLCGRGPPTSGTLGRALCSRRIQCVRGGPAPGDALRRALGLRRAL